MTGRRGKWLVVAAWIVLVVAMAPLGAKLADETTDETESFLPAGAESTEVVKLLEDRFDGGQTVGGLIVYKRDGGLSAEDRRKIFDDARRAGAELPLLGRPSTPFTPGSPTELVAPAGDLAYTVVTLPDRYEELPDWGKDLRAIAGDGGGGLEVFVTGDIGFQTDQDEVFGELDAKLLFATVILVLVLLGAIYRSPVIAIIPLVVVGFAYFIAQGLIYLYASSGADVSTNATSILVVLMFGVGTDYCLLLVSRYREELRRAEDKHHAMERALTRAGPAILASGLTVVAAMLVLLVADTGFIKALGPVSAIGVGAAFLAGITLLPALLTIAGRRGFWPMRSAVAYDPAAADAEAPGVWRRIGDRVLERPALALGVTTAVFALGALGLLAYQEDYSTSNTFKKQVESVDGFEAMREAFPAGTLSPTTILVGRPDGPVTESEIEGTRRLAAEVDGVAGISPTLQRSRDGELARLDVTFATDPYKSKALENVPKLRDRLDDVPPGVRALVGAGSAVSYDFDASSERDIKLIVPLALLLIGVILGVLLRAVVAPLVLIATVVASFFGTLGISLVFFRYVVGDPGVDASLPTFAFIFLVALGIDYTIFLMSRVREEARLHGTREGMLRALSSTGPVITSAGVILAGTFSVLMTLPVTFTFDLGFLVAVGILLDTFVVRTIMLPAAVELLGDRIWWPSTAAGGGGALRETTPETEEEPEPQPASV